jgi:hypothetical protein
MNCETSFYQLLEIILFICTLTVSSFRWHELRYCKDRNRYSGTEYRRHWKSPRMSKQSKRRDKERRAALARANAAPPVAQPQTPPQQIPPTQAPLCNNKASKLRADLTPLPSKVVGFVATVGLGIFINQISGDPRTLYFAAFAFCVYLGHAAGKKWVLHLSFVVVYACIWIGAYELVRFEDYTQFNGSMITLEPGPSVDPKDPFETRFTLRNGSQSRSIYNIVYAGWWNDPQGQAKYWLAGFMYTNPIAELGPNQKRDLKIEGAPYVPHHLNHYAQLGIALIYERDNSHRLFTNLFSFRVSNRNDTYTWLNLGVSESLSEAWARVHQFPGLVRLPEMMPMPEVNIVSFDKLPPTSNSPPSDALKYTIFNHGGQPASNLVFQWHLASPILPIETPFLAQTQWLEGGVLDPGALLTNTILFEDRGVHDAVTASNLVLFCTLHYLDRANHDYGIVFKGKL